MGPITVGDAEIEPLVEGELLRSIGAVRVDGTPLRGTNLRFLPWFDSYEGEVFRSFRLRDVEERGDGVVIRTTAESDPDTLFRERRDSSGDVCLKARHWDAAPEEAALDIHLEPARAEFDGRAFTGFRYWFEYRADRVPIHRIADRQTWELGGDTDRLTLVCRNLFDAPEKELTGGHAFSTVGLHQSVGALPGNLWARWSLLPAFDMQYGPEGTMVAFFDRVSLIRSVIESRPEEDWVRYVDFHGLEQSRTATTNPKTVLFCPDRLDQVDAINLWTRVHDREYEKARTQFGMRREAAPRLAYAAETWRNYTFEETYGPGVDVAEEFGLDQIFIGPVWESGETYNHTLSQLLSEEQIAGTAIEKQRYQNKCTGLDIKAGGSHGGIEGLRRLCERGRAKGIDVVAWMATHLSSRSNVATDKSVVDAPMDLFATKESGKHPDTGYTSECWPLNLNNDAVYEKYRDGFLSIAREAGLAGFLWDSFSNLGWWQKDYRAETMRPQFDRTAQIFADFVNEGLYIMPEAIVSFSSHSCVGLHGGNVYAGGRMPYSYDTNFSLGYRDDDEEKPSDQLKRMLLGEKPVDELFRCFAHRRAPRFRRDTLSEERERWDPEAVRAMKEIIAIYKLVRDRMIRRTVLKDDRGVLWEDDDGAGILFWFHAQDAPAEAVDVLTGEQAGGSLAPKRAYWVDPGALA